MNENLKAILESIKNYTSMEFVKDIEQYFLKWTSDEDKMHGEEYLAFWNECENDVDRNEMVEELKRDIRISKDFAEWKSKNPNAKGPYVKPLTYSEKKLLIGELRYRKEEV